MTLNEMQDMQQRFNAMRLENEGLCTQLKQSQAEVGRLRELVEAILKTFKACPDWVCDEFDDFCGTIDTIEQALSALEKAGDSHGK